MGFLFKASKSLGPLSPRQLLARLVAFQATFVATNSSSAIPVTTTQPWVADSGTWGITSNKAYSVTAGSSYPVASVDTKGFDATVKSTTDNTGAGPGVSFWVTDANNWWGAHSTRTSSTAAPYTCPSGGTLSGTTCSYTYGAASYGTTPHYGYCPGGYTFHGICCLLNGHEWVGCIGASHAAGPTTYTYGCPSGGSLSGTTCYVSYAGTATTYYQHSLAIVKKSAGSVSTVSTTAIANTTSASDYVGYVQAVTSGDTATVTARMTSGGTIASASTPAGTPAKAKKHGMLVGPTTLAAVTTIETFDYTPG